MMSKVLNARMRCLHNVNENACEHTVLLRDVHGVVVSPLLA